ncbi:dynamin family protein [Xinfangfangia sp. CPCC 101601]|uniref:Dynamin family protein n=1 Tax=Pseudogemmobacter lacusdianii TaxID=3069608 RepID=A0ABU0W1N4_9RHOB|nr:dynamin family protein [Xinfangfangia sp. CPCC 101601]MDQ2067874.1 dynamin family protein [Xinfangfangia sp. CPCC 101601]
MPYDQDQDRVVTETAFRRLSAQAHAVPRLAVVGEFSSGKSTLLNLFLGEDALPVRTTATASPAVWLSYGDDEGYYIDAQGQRHNLPAGGLDEVPADSRHVRLFLLSDFLQTCEILDLSGLADPSRTDDLTYEMLGHAQCVIWCTPATQAWRQSERAAWLAVPERIRARSILAITRIDKLRSEQDLERVVRRVKHEAQGLFTAFAPISALMAQRSLIDNDVELWEASGIDALTDALFEQTQAIRAERDNLLGRYKVAQGQGDGLVRDAHEAAPEPLALTSAMWSGATESASGVTDEAQWSVTDAAPVSQSGTAYQADAAKADEPSEGLQAFPEAAQSVGLDEEPVTFDLPHGDALAATMAFEATVEVSEPEFGPEFAPDTGADVTPDPAPTTVQAGENLTPRAPVLVLVAPQPEKAADAQAVVEGGVVDHAMVAEEPEPLMVFETAIETDVQPADAQGVGLELALNQIQDGKALKVEVSEPEAEAGTPASLGNFVEADPEPEPIAQAAANDFDLAAFQQQLAQSDHSDEPSELPVDRGPLAADEADAVPDQPAIATQVVPAKPAEPDAILPGIEAALQRVLAGYFGAPAQPAAPPAATEGDGASVPKETQIWRDIVARHAVPEGDRPIVAMIDELLTHLFAPQGAQSASADSSEIL